MFVLLRNPFADAVIENPAEQLRQIRQVTNSNVSPESEAIFGYEQFPGLTVV